MKRNRTQTEIVIMKYKIALAIVAALAFSGVASGALAIDSSILVPAFPEPGEFWMILAALALIAFMVSRRSGGGTM
jgi:hypothetical protein